MRRPDTSKKTSSSHFAPRMNCLSKWAPLILEAQLPHTGGLKAGKTFASSFSENDITEIPPPPSLVLSLDPESVAWQTLQMDVFPSFPWDMTEFRPHVWEPDLLLHNNSLSQTKINLWSSKLISLMVLIDYFQVNGYLFLYWSFHNYKTLDMIAEKDTDSLQTLIAVPCSWREQLQPILRKWFQ